jgi:hypothetical protein
MEREREPGTENAQWGFETPPADEPLLVPPDDGGAQEEADAETDAEAEDAASKAEAMDEGDLAPTTP